MITAMRFASAAEDCIHATLDSGTVIAVPYPCHTWINELLQDAMAGGMTIKPYQTTAEALTAAQETAWSNIKAKRDALKLAGGVKVAVDGTDKWFHTTLDARAQYANLYAVFAALPEHTVPNWRTMDGSFVTMTAELLAAIQLNGAIQESAIFAVGIAHETAMMALTTAAAVAAYDYSTGWPVTYSA